MVECMYAVSNEAAPLTLPPARLGSNGSRWRPCSLGSAVTAVEVAVKHEQGWGVSWPVCSRRKAGKHIATLQEGPAAAAPCQQAYSTDGPAGICCCAAASTQCSSELAVGHKHDTLSVQGQQCICACSFALV